MRIHDISVTITPAIVTWGNSDPGIVRKWDMRIGDGDACNLSTITIGSHCGTHLDAPLHFLAGGSTVETLALEDIVGPCQVVEFGDLPKSEITATALDSAQIGQAATRLVFKTSNSRRRLLHDRKFHTDFVAIAPDGARWLVDHGIRTVGVDYLSVGAAEGSDGAETHRILLGANVVLLEGLLLDDVPAGAYTLVALPLKIAGAEGCPMRAVLIEDRIGP